jgi:O-antigen/teichoic acid export membrane protein
VSVARHTVYNLAGSIVPIAVTLVTVPLYLQAIGLERYGVLALVWVLAGYFVFFDFGIGRATARKMATLANAASDARNRLFWTSASITVALAGLAALIFWPVAGLFVRQMDIPAELLPELREAMPLLVLAVPVGVVQSLLTGVLDGRRAFGAANAIALVGNVLTAVVPLASAWIFGPRLSLLISATLLARGVVLVAQFLVCRLVVPLGRPEHDGGAEVAALVKFGGWVTVTGIAGPLLVYFDRFAIGAWIGAEAVGFYVVGYNLISQMQAVPGAFARAMFPRLAELDGEESMSRSNDAIRVMIALVTPMTIVAMILMTPFLDLWLGPEVSRVTGHVTILLLLGFWPNAMAFIAFARLQAMGRPDLSAKVHVAELIPYATLLFGGIHVAGLAGAAAVWSVRCTFDLLLLAHLSGQLRAMLHYLFGGTLFVGAAAVVAMLVGSPVVYWPAGIALSLFSAAWSWSILPEHVRRQAASFRRNRLSFRKSRS